jgi:hypothetical protein
MTSAQFAFAQAAVAVTISGLEELQNAGKEKIIDLMSARIEQRRTHDENNLSSDFYSDGTADGGKQVGGLQAWSPMSHLRHGRRHQPHHLAVLAQPPRASPPKG